MILKKTSVQMTMPLVREMLLVLPSVGKPPFWSMEKQFNPYITSHVVTMGHFTNRDYLKMGHG